MLGMKLPHFNKHLKTWNVPEAGHVSLHIPKTQRGYHLDKKLIFDLFNLRLVYIRLISWDS